MSVPNTLPTTLTCCLNQGTEHEQKSNAERWIKQTLKNCDVIETRDNYTVQVLPNKAIFTLKDRP